MSRFASGVFVVYILLLLSLASIGCGGAKTTSTVPTAASISLTPTTAAMDVGSTLQFVASAKNSANQVFTTPITYTSSDPSVLSFVPAAGGLACAGRWDSAGTVCTPQSVGIAQVTASANGVSSPSVTVYVHQHIDQIQLSLFNPPTPVPPCVTLAQVQGVQNFLDFQARAFSRGIDITNSVGSFTFTLSNTTVANQSSTAPELQNNNGQQITQVRVTANAPGIAQLSASSTGVNSLPVTFETCLIQSIQLQAGDSASNVTFTVNKGSSQTITPTIIDRSGQTLTKGSLTWASLAPANASVNSSGVAQGVAAGGSTITASCIQPSCNIGLVPPTPVFASNVVTGIVTASPASTNAFATTTQCGTINGCQPFLFPISTSTNVVGNPVVLPSSPNSFIFNPGNGTKAYLGSSQGLMTFTPGGGSSQISQRNDIPGKVLTVSLDGNKVVVSDTQSNPNRVFILDQTSGTSAPLTTLLINAATAAQFSPDGQKLSIVASAHPVGNPLHVPGDTVYVYSTVDALKIIPFPGVPNAPPNSAAVSYQATGGLFFLAGVDPNAIQIVNTCDPSLPTQTISAPSVPVLFQTVPDGVHAIGLAPPGIEFFTANVPQPPPPAPNSQIKCQTFAIASSSSTFFNLGQGDFTPLQLIVRPDSSKANVVANNLGSIFSFDIGVGTVTAIPLAGNPVPLSASLSSDGTLMYVGTSDAKVHVLSTVSQQDLQQISFPMNTNNNNNVGLCSNIPATCNPDLVAVAP